jgi:small subunit ribosomal protein S6
VRPYDLMLLLRTDVEDHKAFLDDVQALVNTLGGEVAKVDVWGKRRLAYPVEKEQEGFYAIFNMKLDPAQVVELDRVLKLRPQVLRHMVIRLDE